MSKRLRGAVAFGLENGKVNVVANLDDLDAMFKKNDLLLTLLNRCREQLDFVPEHMKDVTLMAEVDKVIAKEYQ